MRYSEKISDLLNLRKGEVRVVTILMLYSFFQTGALALFFTAASAIFLTQYPISSLSYVYMATCVLLLFTNLIYGWLSRYFEARRLMLAEVVVLLIMIIIFRVGLGYGQLAWLAFGLIVWHRVMSAYMIAGFNRLALLLFDVRQSKRLFGLITSTETPANGLGYWLASGLVPLIGTANLLWISAIALLFALVFLTLITTRKEVFIFEETAAEANLIGKIDQKGIIRKFFTTHFIFNLSVTCLLAVITFTLIEFAFLSQVNERFSSQTDIAFFLGMILGSGQLIAFCIKTFLYGQVMRRFGIRMALFALPFVLVMVTLFGVLSSLLSANSWWLAGIWVVIMLVNDTLRSALYNNTFISLLQPLPKSLKLIGLDILGNIEAVAVGISGLVLVAFSSITALSLYHFSFFLLLVLAGWIFSIRGLIVRYILTLEKALKKRILEGRILQLNDPQTRSLLTRKLDSPYPGEVLYALDILGKGDSAQLPTLLRNLLSHPFPEVRTEVLKKIEALKLLDLQPQIAERIRLEEIPEIKKRAIQVYCILGEDAVVDEISPLLDSPEPMVQTGALVGLICYGGINGVIMAGQQLNKYIHAPEPEKRAFAAYVIGEVGIRHFYHPLLQLVKDENVVVRKAALRASGKINHPGLYADMLEAISSPEVFEVAVQALIRTGEGVINLFEDEFNKPDFNPVRLRRLIYICGKVGGEKAIQVLKNKLYFKNIEVRNQILHSLVLCDYNPNSSEKEEVLRTIYAELSDATWFINCIDVILTTATARELRYFVLLVHALETELYHLKKRLLFLLSYIYDANDVLQVWESMQMRNKEKKANALEILDVLIAKELSSLILPLLEDFPVSQQVKILNARFPQKRMELADYLQKLINRQEVPVVNIWTQAVTIYVVRQLLLIPLLPEVVLAITHPNRLVAETACWALNGFDPESYVRFLSSLNHQATYFQEKIQNTMKEPTTSRLLAVEKVMALKTTRMFAETAEDILVDIAAIMKEVEVQAGEKIVQKDETGTCMFIIYQGSVRVHDGEHTLAELKNRDFFGEFSLLDTEPRSASVTALEDSLLLRLDQHAFYEIMTDRMEVIREIMKILCRRLRYQNKLVADMKEQLSQHVEKKELEKPS